ncbi:hypothetical protein E2C01_001321 [Portunus trituberculatus]|uniref:Uncharacterized protein n=1 Tax=Portunus trituberculatus TaxID=210409 RepID=A0A5B7CGV7_PORTR|nr:hypothetical protein [Portunus trituberculatus]
MTSTLRQQGDKEHSGKRTLAGQRSEDPNDSWSPSRAPLPAHSKNEFPQCSAGGGMERYYCYYYYYHYYDYYRAGSDVTAPNSEDAGLGHCVREGRAEEQGGVREGTPARGGVSRVSGNHSKLAGPGWPNPFPSLVFLRSKGYGLP